MSMPAICSNSTPASSSGIARGSLVFPKADYTAGTKTVTTSGGDKKVTYHFYQHLPYVAKPVDANYESMKVSVPVNIESLKEQVGVLKEQEGVHQESQGRSDARDFRSIGVPTTWSIFFTASLSSSEPCRSSGRTWSASACCRPRQIAPAGPWCPQQSSA